MQTTNAERVLGPPARPTTVSRIECLYTACTRLVVGGFTRSRPWKSLLSHTRYAAYVLVCIRSFDIANLGRLFNVRAKFIDTLFDENWIEVCP